MFENIWDRSPDELYEEELDEAEQMIRNGAGMRQIMHRQFSFVKQSDIYKLYRKYGMDPEEDHPEYF